MQRRATLELWPDVEEMRPLRGAGTLINSVARPPPGARLPDRLLPLVGRGPRGPRHLRGRPQRRWLSPDQWLRAIVSDFGGVLTTPLLAAFAAFQDEIGISAENLGKAMRAGLSRGRGDPAVPARARRDQRGRVPRAARATGSSRSSATAPTSTTSARCSSGALDPNEEMIALMRELKASGLKMAMLTNNVREWEPLWRSMLPVDEIFEDDRRLRLRRLPQAGSADLRADPGADRAAGRGLPLHRRPPAEHRGRRSGRDERGPLPRQRAGDRRDPRRARASA